MGAMQRSKGARAEREVLKLLGDKPAKVPRLYLPLLRLADPDQFDLFEDEYGPVWRNDNSPSGEG